MVSSTHDQLYKFIFDDLEVRGEIVQLHDVYSHIFANKSYPKAIKKILAQLVVISNLITASTKIEGETTVEIRGDGLLRYASINSDNKLNVRGIARHNISQIDEDYSFREIVGANAILLITVHPKDSEPYQGVVEVTGYNLSDTLENYFLRSEQIRTKIMLEISLTDKDSSAAGILVQELPTDDPAHEDDFNTVVHLVNTLTKDELINLEADEVLFRLFNEFKVRRFDAINVNFKCGCSKKKCLDTIHQLGKEEVYSVINSSADPEHVESLVMTCSQCGKKYIFKKEDIEKLFSNDK